jgi:hypothetical protein
VAANLNHDMVVTERQDLIEADGELEPTQPIDVGRVLSRRFGKVE